MKSRRLWQFYTGGKPRVLLLYATFIMALLGVLLPLKPKAEDLNAALQGPSWHHLLGTNALGSDLLVQIVDGAPTSVLVALVVAGLTGGIGISLGAIAGYLGGLADQIVTWLINFFLTVPPLFFVLVTVSIYGASTLRAALVIGLCLWAGTARQTRAQFIGLRKSEFVLAARAMGMSRRRMIFSEILPNAIQPALVQCALTGSAAVLIFAGLGFLGLSDPEATEWGAIVSTNLTNQGVTAWWPLIFPCIAIGMLVAGLNGFADMLSEKLGGGTDR